LFVQKFFLELEA